MARLPHGGRGPARRIRRRGPAVARGGAVVKETDAVKTVPTTCPFCSCGCGLYLHTTGETLSGFVPDRYPLADFDDAGADQNATFGKPPASGSRS